jgi:hypothetical protein
MAYAPRSSRKNPRSGMEKDAEALCDTCVYKKAEKYIYFSLLGNTSSIPPTESLAYYNTSGENLNLLYIY